MTLNEIKTAKPPIYRDELDEEIIAVVEQTGKITLSDLPKERPELAEVPRGLLWYRAHSLSENGYIRCERARRNLILYPMEG